MHKTSLTGIIIIIILFLVLSGILAANIEIGESLPGIDSTATTSSVFDIIWSNITGWIGSLWDSLTPW